MLHFSLPATLPTQQRRGLFGTVTVHRASRVGSLVGRNQEFCIRALVSNRRQAKRRDRWAISLAELRKERHVSALEPR